MNSWGVQSNSLASSASLGETAFGTDFGGSSKYLNESFES